ncbi:transcriptional regulator MvaT, P16 subunit [gamma proteobacterium BDW918]|jgi:hypothetical protein|nr:transcriptional regulator MvaT, P16 subunit [gamma proteobacterium BDW918]
MFIEKVFMDIAKLQKQLQAEHKALDQKFKFISELQALMTKYGQSAEDLVAILSAEPAADTPPVKKRGRKAGVKKAAAGIKKTSAAAAPAKPRKKMAPRPLRSFKNPKTGEVTKTRAPQVDKVIKNWAQELKVDWRSLEI